MVLLIMCCLGLFLLVALVNTGAASMEQWFARLDEKKAIHAKNLREEMERLELLEGRRLAMRQMSKSDEKVQMETESVDARTLSALDDRMQGEVETPKLQEVSTPRSTRKKKLTAAEKLHQENEALRVKMQELEKQLTLRRENAELKAKFAALEERMSKAPASIVDVSSEDLKSIGFVEELVVSHDDVTQPLIEISLSDQ